MTELDSGKTHRDENFPVASWLLQARHRAPIMAFYRYARAADDVADHETASADEKLRLLDEMERTLLGELDSAPEAYQLRLVLAERNLSAQHALLLLEAFRRDVTKLRYADWDELIDYCRFSAMPVGRFVLDVHGEDRAIWPASDALCAALQVINHLQDCGKDYRGLGRVYLPADVMAQYGADPGMLAGSHAKPALRRVIGDLAARTATLLTEAKPFASQIRDRRLALEVNTIQVLAESLDRRLAKRDPLSQRVHHHKIELAPLALAALGRFLKTRRRFSQQAAQT